MKISGISGSLKQASLNTMLLKNVESVLPYNSTLEIQRLDDIILYNEDLNNEWKPEEIIAFINAIQYSDALLFATLEYNHSIPGVLKNAKNWALRSAF